MINIFIFLISLIFIYYFYIYCFLDQNHKKKEHNQEKIFIENRANVIPIINIGLTIYNYKKMKIFIENKDPNDNIISNYLTSLFPLQINDNLLKSDILVLPSYRLLTLSKSGNFQIQSLKKGINSYANDFYFLCNLYEQEITCIVNESMNNNISFNKNTRIGAINNHNAYYFLLIIKKILNLQIDVIKYENISLLFKGFIEKKIDSIFLICTHPNDLLKTFSFTTKILFFDFYSLFNRDEVTIKLIQFYFPELRKSTLRLFDYRTFNNTKIIDSCKIILSLFATNNENYNNYIIPLIKSLLESLDSLSTKHNFLTMNIDHFHICPEQYNYHPNIIDFYKEKNRITNIIYKNL